MDSWYGTHLYTILWYGTHFIYIETRSCLWSSDLAYLQWLLEQKLGSSTIILVKYIAWEPSKLSVHVYTIADRVMQMRKESGMRRV